MCWKWVDGGCCCFPRRIREFERCDFQNFAEGQEEPRGRRLFRLNAPGRNRPPKRCSRINRWSRPCRGQKRRRRIGSDRLQPRGAFIDSRQAGTYMREAYSLSIRLAEKRGTIERKDSFAIWIPP